MREVGYGMHVITVMFTCFLAGYVVGRRLSDDKTIQYGVGCLGMIAAMMVEAGLFMIRFPRLYGEEEKGAMGRELAGVVTTGPPGGGAEGGEGAGGGAAKGGRAGLPAAGVGSQKTKKAGAGRGAESPGGGGKQQAAAAAAAALLPR